MAAQTSETKSTSPRPTFLSILGALLLLIFELILPSILIAAAVTYLSSKIPVWTLDRTFALILVGVIFVVFSLAVSVLVDSFTASTRRSSPARKIINRLDPRSRLIKFFLAGVLVPLAVYLSANLVTAPLFGQSTTAMNLLIQYTQIKVPAAQSSLIGDLVLKSSDSETRIQAIKTLQSLGNSDGIGQLSRILTSQPQILDEDSAYQAMVGAVASYGPQAKAQLFDLFNRVPAGQRASSGIGPSPYERYFSAPIESLRGEIQTQTSDPRQQAAQLDELATTEANLKQSLGQLELSQTQSSDRRLDFVMDTFLAMDLKSDPDLLAFARKIGADASYTDDIRGKALLLVGKQGSKDDAGFLYPFLSSQSIILQRYALEAIAALQAPPAANSSTTNK